MMPIYNLLGYSNIYGKILASLWQYFRNKPDRNGIIMAFKFKSRFTSNTDNTGTVNVEIAVP